MSQPFTRRSLLRHSAVVSTGLVGAAVLAACGATAATSTSTATTVAPSSSKPPATTSAASAATAASSVVSTTRAVTTSAAKATPTPQFLGTGKKAAVTIWWYINSNDQDPKVIQNQFLPAFEQANPDIAVEATIGPGGIIAAIEKYIAYTVGGTPPDLFFVTRAAADLARRNLFSDLSPLIARDKFDTNRYPQAPYLYESTLGGKVFGLPMSMQAEAMALAYNRDLFRKVGVAEPGTTWGDGAWTWQQMVDAARKLTVMGRDGATLTQSGIGGLAYNVHLPVLWEGTWVAPKLDQATCDSAAMVDCYSSYFALARQDKVMPGYFGLKGPSSLKDFMAGTVAITTVGGWQFSPLLQAKTDWAFAPWPKAKRSTYAYNPEEGNIARQSKHVEQTWTLLKWMDAGSRYATTFGFMPVATADAAKWVKSYFGGRPADVRPQVLSDALAVAQPTDPIFLLDGTDAFIRATIEPALSKQIPGGADVRTTLQSVKGPLQQLVQQCACSGTAPPY